MRQLENVHAGCRSRPTPRESIVRRKATTCIVIIVLPSSYIIGFVLCLSEILKHDDGYLLKPLQASPKKEREENFYRRVFSQSDDPDVLTLRKFIPNFYGVHVEHANGQGQDQIY